MNLYIAYQEHFGKSFSPTDWEPNMYLKIAIFDDELEALRYGNFAGATVVKIEPGDTLESAIMGGRVTSP